VAGLPSPPPLLSTRLTTGGAPSSAGAACSVSGSTSAGRLTFAAVLPTVAGCARRAGGAAGSTAVGVATGATRAAAGGATAAGTETTETAEAAETAAGTATAVCELMLGSALGRTARPPKCSEQARGPAAGGTSGAACSAPGALGSAPGAPRPSAGRRPHLALPSSKGPAADGIGCSPLRSGSACPAEANASLKLRLQACQGGSDQGCRKDWMAQAPVEVQDEQAYFYKTKKTKFRHLQPLFTCLAEKIGNVNLYLNNEHSYSISSTHHINDV